MRKLLLMLIVGVLCLNAAYSQTIMQTQTPIQNFVG